MSLVVNLKSGNFKYMAIKDQNDKTRTIITIIFEDDLMLHRHNHNHIICQAQVQIKMKS